MCTNKREYLSRKLLEALGLGHYFQSVAGRDTFEVSKPDPGHLTQVSLAGGMPSRAIMVGDSDVDIATAKRRGCLVSFGYAPNTMGKLAPHVDYFDQFARDHRPPRRCAG